MLKTLPRRLEILQKRKELKKLMEELKRNGWEDSDNGYFIRRKVSKLSDEILDLVGD